MIVDDCGGVYVDSVCCCIEIVYLVAWFVWVLLLGWCGAGGIMCALGFTCLCGYVLLPGVLWFVVILRTL